MRKETEHKDPFSLAGRRAVVTGGNRGIGAAIVLALARAGADVVSVHRSAEEPPVAAQVRTVGRSYAVVRADLAQVDDVQAIAERIIAQHGPIDILVNNAGLIIRRPAAEVPLHEWRLLLDTDLTAAFVLCQAFGRPMLERQSGAIVNIASALSFQGGINVPAYAAAKSGLAGLTRALANEWAGRGVNVNAVAPGYIATDQTAPLLADAVRSEQISVRIPAGRWGRPEDVAGAVVFLCSPAAAWVHGHVLAVDGGWLSR
jgi:2-dehydro-3-deoxy-D-gluconate 5-dehydrogenase